MDKTQELRFVQFHVGHHPDTHEQMIFGLTAHGILYQHWQGAWSIYPMTYTIGT